jgi:acetylornithine deacetylase
MAAHIGPLQRVEIIDDTTATLHYDVPWVTVLDAFRRIPIWSPTAAEQWGIEEFDRHLVGAGPFTLEEWVPNDHVTLKRWEGYGVGATRRSLRCGWSRFCQPHGDRIACLPHSKEVTMSGRPKLVLIAMIAMALYPHQLRAYAAQDPQSEEELFRTIDRNRESHLTFLQSLIRAQPDGEAAVQALVAARFEELGLEVETQSLLPIGLSPAHEFAAEEMIQMTERVSVMGRLRGTGNGRSMLFFGHPDPEPMTEESMAGWERDPFAAEVDDGRLYGWGVADDLAGVAIMAEAVAAVLETVGTPRGDILLASTPAKRNARGIVGLLNVGYHADASVYLHPAESEKGLEDIKAITSGLLRFRITVKGESPDTPEPGQTAFAHLAVSAVDKASSVLSALRDLDEDRAERVFHPALDAAVGRSTNLLTSHVSCGASGSTTQVPTECVIEGSTTFPPNEQMPDVQEEILDAIDRASRGDRWLAENPPVVEWLAGTQGVEVPRDHPLYQTVHRAVVEVTGVEPEVNPLHSGSDIRNPKLFSDIPSVGIGPLAGDLTQAGGHDEWVDIEDYIRAIKICAKIIVDWSN